MSESRYLGKGPKCQKKWRHLEFQGVVRGSQIASEAHRKVAYLERDKDTHRLVWRGAGSLVQISGAAPSFPP